MTDKAWQKFSRLLNEHMKDARISSRDLAIEAGLTETGESVVSNWRRGRSAPPLSMLGGIVDGLNRLLATVGHPQLTMADVLKRMDILVGAPHGQLDLESIDEKLVAKAFRLQKLELKIEEANSAAAEFGRNGGTAAVVRAAVKTGNWAVAVWPAWEGPNSDDLIHVADRIDIMRVPSSRERLTAEEVWRDPEMKAALRAARAIRGTVSPRSADGIKVPVSSWAIVHLGSPRDALLPDRWPGLPGSICFIATTLNSWANDVAAIVALQIGYGLTSVRDLVMEIEGVDTRDLRANLRVHDQLVHRPPQRRVWSYVGGLGIDNSEIDAEIRRAVEGETTFVIFEEPDDSLKDMSNRPGARSLDEFSRDYEALERLSKALPADRVIRIQTLLLPERARRWEQALQNSLTVLRALELRGVVSRSPDLMRAAAAGAHRYPDVAGPIKRWMESSGWASPSPVVESPKP